MDGRATPLVVAHRGGLAERCESTLAAFASCAARGATGVECDVHPSADGVLVVYHDPTLRRGAGDPRPISSLTWSELRRIELACGSRPGHLARLEEVLEVTSGLVCSIDVKSVTDRSGATEAAVVEALRATRALERAVVASFHHDVLERVRARAPWVRTAASPREVARWLARLDHGPAWSVLSVPRRWRGLPLVTAQSVERLHREGREVWVWTVNEPVEARQLATAGVDAIITDAPQLIARALAPPREVGSSSLAPW